MESILAKLGENHIIPEGYSGVISIKRKGEILHEQVYGHADIPNERKNRIDTKFVTASAGKAFTATGILKLIEQGKLRFDSTIGEVIDMDWKQIDRSITVRELLTHTSGIPDYCDETIVPEYSDIFIDYPNYRIRKSEDMIPLFIDMPMAYARGARMHYNNTGFVVLGLMIEQVTGIPFDEYLRREVFLPCGMKNTGYFEYDRLPANCANVYIYDKEQEEYYTNIYSSTAKGIGDGGAFTTVEDVERFWQGIFGGRVLSEGMAEQMTAPQVAENCYGYGLWLEKLDNVYIPHFEGCEPGISFMSIYDRQKDLTITFISNKGDDIWKMSRKVLKEFYDEMAEYFYYGE